MVTIRGTESENKNQNFGVQTNKREENISSRSEYCRKMFAPYQCQEFCFLKQCWNVLFGNRPPIPDAPVLLKEFNR
jgi:hypothetical protein